ncbi:hypothetical protein C7S18_05850 [Ahniella affigens]|uniref:Uncharacterized protein n=1 Tax=Ahniella affigens TaxID=2021234 RepID=A0A2P1PPH6_9GAMM|nr:hypothetical protein [Ahniella affigens]AVP96750.1 hypothetical protein C7S18_05850 [Ahniella affigens]
MKTELIIIVVLTVLVLGMVFMGLRAVRREAILRQLLDDADTLEARVLETRVRMRDLEALLGRLPADITESARNTLNSEAGVQQALRLILQHRLWIRDHIHTASISQLRQVRDKVRCSLVKLNEQLGKLDTASDELKHAYAKSDALIGRGEPEAAASDSRE